MEPVVQPPIGPQSALAGGDLQDYVTEDRRCIGCAYDLRGVPKSSKCPECGLDVARSLLSNLLINSTPKFVGKLHRGVIWIQTALVASLLAVLAPFLTGFFVAYSAGPNAGWGPFIAFAICVGVSFLVLLIAEVVSIIGWWSFSTLDPRNTGRDRGETPRLVLRISVIASAVGLLLFLGLFALSIVLASQAAAATASAAAAAPGTPTTPPVIGSGRLLASGLPNLAFLAMAAASGVRYFASLVYIGWLGPRVPDDRVKVRSERMMWLGPVLFCIGGLCVGIGALIAFVLYYNMLDWLRKDLKHIRREQPELDFIP